VSAPGEPRRACGWRREGGRARDADTAWSSMSGAPSQPTSRWSSRPRSSWWSTPAPRTIYQEQHDPVEVFARGGAVIELRPLKTREERLKF